MLFEMKRMAQQACVQEAGRVASDGVARRPVPKALKGDRSERLWRRKQPQQAPSAQGKQVMRSPHGASFLHSRAGLRGFELLRLGEELPRERQVARGAAVALTLQRD